MSFLKINIRLKISYKINTITMTSLYCNICNIELYNIYSFRRHLESAKHLENNAAYQESLELEHCKYCSKGYKHKSSLSRHESTCKKAPVLTYVPRDELPNTTTENQIVPVTSRNNQVIPSTTNNVQAQVANINNGMLNNGTINNTQNNIAVTQNITIVPFGKEDLSMLTDEIKKKIVEREKRAFITLINEKYKNDKNYNIYVSDKRNGLVKFLDENNQVQQALLKVKAEEFMELNKKLIDNMIDEYLDCFRTPTQNRLLDIKSDHAFGSFDDKYMKIAKEKLLEISEKGKSSVKQAVKKGKDVVPTLPVDG